MFSNQTVYPTRDSYGLPSANKTEKTIDQQTNKQANQKNEK